MTNNEKNEIFESAMNDWPTQTNTIEDFINEVENFLNAKSNKNNIEQKLSTIDFAKNAWESESLVQMLEIFNYYSEEMSLNEIYARLKLENE